MKEKKLLLGVPCSKAEKEMDADILYPIPRVEDRQLIGYDPDFQHVGIDIWNAYEFSFLDPEGKAKQGVLQIRYDASSEFIIESKSLKLYLNSFDSVRKPTVEVESIIKADLSRESKSTVDVAYYSYREFNQSYPVNSLDSVMRESDVQFISLDEVDLEEIFQPTADTLMFISETLRSNCKFTKQPDSGVAIIYIRGSNLPTPKHMYYLLAKMRTENHFHEEIAERVLQDLIKSFNPDAAAVRLAYHRRGGIDINPIRYWSRTGEPVPLADIPFVRWVGQ